MRGFAFLTVFLAAGVFLLEHFSFWMTFVLMYLSGMLIVVCVAFIGRRQSSSSVGWADPVEVEQGK